MLQRVSPMLQMCFCNVGWPWHICWMCWYFLCGSKQWHTLATFFSTTMWFVASTVYFCYIDLCRMLLYFLLHFASFYGSLKKTVAKRCYISENDTYKKITFAICLLRRMLHAHNFFLLRANCFCYDDQIHGICSLNCIERPRDLLTFFLQLIPYIFIANSTW